MIPRELRAREQWVNWRYVDRPSGNGKTKRTKLPVNPHNVRTQAKTNDSSTWASYEKALGNSAKRGIAGVAYVFSDDDPYCGVDWDGVCEGFGEIDPDVLSVIKELGTYTEYSPSGRGVHTIGCAVLPDGSRHRAFHEELGCDVEVYDRLRMFCMTGNRVRGTKAKLTTFDPIPLVNALGNGRANGKSSVEAPSRHNALLSMAADLVRQGMNRDQLDVALRAKAIEIGLPKRESDEVGRIVDFFEPKRSRDARVEQKAEQLRIAREAQVKVNAELSGASDVEFINAVDALAKPDEPVHYLVDAMFPARGNVLLNAERKAGKTTLCMSLVKAIIDEQPFLGSYAVDVPEGKVAYLNYELDESMFNRWLRKRGINNLSRLLLLHMRGRVGGLPFWLPNTRDQLVQQLLDQNVWCLIIDPQMMACTGLVQDENNNMEMAEFHNAIDIVKQLAGVQCCFMAHHIGKADKERGRGASRIEDWPDALWYLSKSDDGRRTLKVGGGRFDDGDDLVPGITLGFDRESGLYRDTGLTYREAKLLSNAREFLVELSAWHKAHGRWPSGSVTRKLLIHGKTTARSEFLADVAGRGLVQLIGKTGAGGNYTVEITEKGFELVDSH